jgi:hypothetical protein
MSPRHRAHYLTWAERFATSQGDTSGRVGVVQGQLYHLYHGSLPLRRYRERQQILRAFDLDPQTDLAHDDRGPWRWNSSKPELHAKLKEYFAARAEDAAPKVAFTAPSIASSELSSFGDAEFKRQ